MINFMIGGMFIGISAVLGFASLVILGIVREEFRNRNWFLIVLSSFFTLICAGSTVALFFVGMRFIIGIF